MFVAREKKRLSMTDLESSVIRNLWQVLVHALAPIHVWDLSRVAVGQSVSDLIKRFSKCNTFKAGLLDLEIYLRYFTSVIALRRCVESLCETFQLYWNT